MVHVVATSQRVAPDLLTAAAWQVIQGADRVVATDLADPLVVAVRVAGIPVYHLPEISGRWQSLVVLAPHGDRAAVEELAQRFAGSGHEVTVVEGSHDLAGARLLDLVAVMDRLRTGCPWDREQSHQSLARYLLEEAYETLEAIESGDRAHLREELGDLLLQVVFHARLAAEHPDDPWDIDDVAADIAAKLIHRHPHVFAGLDVQDVAQVESNWERLKASEKQRESVLAGVPVALPALARADKLLSRAARAGHGDVPVPSGSDASAAVGDALFDLVREARGRGIDPEQALRSTLARFDAAVRAAEAARD